MRKFKLIEEQCFYREYEIEAKNFEDAYQKWLDNPEDVETAYSNAEWEPGEKVELYRIDDIENDDYWYCN